MATIDSVIAAQDKKQKQILQELAEVKAMLQRVLSVLQPDEEVEDGAATAQKSTSKKTESAPAEK